MSITAPRNTNSPATRRSLRTPAVSLLVLVTLSAGFSTPAHADPISFQNTTVIDATPAGGAADTPLRVTYTFDSDLPPSNGDGVTYSAYEPIRMIVELGDECAAISGAGASIDVLNDAGDPASDSYGIVAVDPATNGKTLYGRQIEIIQVVLIDFDSTMFSDTSLPTSADFAASADLSQILIQLEVDLGGILLFGEGAVQFSAYDPEGTLAAIQESVAGMQLNVGVEQSLQIRLTKAAGYFNGTSKSNDKAEQQLRAFIAQVQGLSGKEIASGDAADLIAAATNLIDQLPACS